MEAIHQGGCLCGALRYRIDAALDDVAHCHCSLCRRSSGGIVVTWATLPRTVFQWLAGRPASYESTPGNWRRFCGHCGTQLVFESEQSPDSLDVTIASLDHPERVPAQRHIWVKSRLPWLHLDEQLPEEQEEQL